MRLTTLLGLILAAAGLYGALYSSSIFFGLLTTGLYLTLMPKAKNAETQPTEQQTQPNQPTSVIPQTTSPPITCPNCGAALKADETFCPRCGARVKKQ